MCESIFHNQPCALWLEGVKRQWRGEEKSRECDWFSERRHQRVPPRSAMWPLGLDVEVNTWWFRELFVLQLSLWQAWEMPLQIHSVCSENQPGFCHLCLCSAMFPSEKVKDGEGSKQNFSTLPHPWWFLPVASHFHRGWSVLYHGGNILHDLMLHLSFIAFLLF